MKSTSTTARVGSTISSLFGGRTVSTWEDMCNLKFSPAALAAVSLDMSDTTTKYSEAEFDVLKYILLGKLSWKKGNVIRSWDDVAKLWPDAARKKKHLDKNSKVFIRTATQLKEKWHNGGWKKIMNQ